MNDLTQIVNTVLCIRDVYVHAYFLHSQMNTVHCNVIITNVYCTAMYILTFMKA